MGFSGSIFRLKIKLILVFGGIVRVLQKCIKL